MTTVAVIVIAVGVAGLAVTIPLWRRNARRLRAEYADLKEERR